MDAMAAYRPLPGPIVDAGHGRRLDVRLNGNVERAQRGTWNLHPSIQGDPQFTTVIYLDDDPLVTAKALAPLLEERWSSGAVRPLFAGPLRTMIQWEAWR